VHRVALTADIVERFNLPPQPGKATDSRAAGFIRKHGALVQVELDALDPEDLRSLYQGAFTQFFDPDVYDEVIERERAERAELQP
jgi:hypothetical protein